VLGKVKKLLKKLTSSAFWELPDKLWETSSIAARIGEWTYRIPRALAMA
jgi:hypothetical protein